jgi:hypothetical protein
MVVGVAHGSRRRSQPEPDPFTARGGGGGELAWWVRYEGLICVDLKSRTLVVVISQASRGGWGTSSELW